jgi:hypothetical protein
MRALVLVALLGCGRAHVGGGLLAAHSAFADEPGPGVNIEAGGWLRGERFGVFGVAEFDAYAVGNDADPATWLGLDARGRTLLYRSERWRVPLVYGGGLGFEVGYINDAIVTALGEIGIERDVGPLVLGARARARAGTFIGDGTPALHWHATGGILVDVGYTFE